MISKHKATNDNEEPTKGGCLAPADARRKSGSAPRRPGLEGGLKAVARSVRVVVAGAVLCLYLPSLPTLGQEGDSARPSLATLARKHDARLETWSVVSRVRKPNGNERFTVLILSSGSMFGVPGNLICGSTLERPSNRFRFEADLLVPPFETVDHNTQTLDERFDDSTLRWNETASRFEMTSKLFSDQRAWTFRADKPILLFGDVFGGKPGDKRFDWYLIPRLTGRFGASIEAVEAPADGHLQQFWGAPSGQNADWMVAHLDSGYDIMLTRFKPEARDKPWLPGDYLAVSRPDGTMAVTSAFELTVLERWTRPGSDPPRRYAVDVRMTAEDPDISLRITAFRKDQTGRVGGRELWLGFGQARARTADGVSDGWAYLSPIANNPADAVK